jgi:hypothetical protein
MKVCHSSRAAVFSFGSRRCQHTMKLLLLDFGKFSVSAITKTAAGRAKQRIRIG